jgi:hypothetical protein
MRDLPLGVSPRTDKTYVRTKENAGAVRGSDVAEDGKGFFSIEHPEKLFTFDGSLKLKRFSPPNAYRQFFEHGGRIAKERGSTVLRGPRYVCALDQNLAFAHKLQILLDDYNDAL